MLLHVSVHLDDLHGTIIKIKNNKKLNILVEGVELLPRINLNLSAIAISVLGSRSRCLDAAAVPTTETFF